MARRPRRDTRKREALVDEALVLRVTPVGDDDGIVTLLLREHGKIPASVKRLRSVRSGFAGRFEVLNHVRVAFEQRRDYLQVREAALLTPAFPVLSRPEVQPFGLYLAELADELLPERDPAPQAFRLLGKALLAMGAGIEPRQVVRYVEYWLLRLSGHVPDHAACAACGNALVPPPEVARDAPARNGSVAIGRDGLVCSACARASPVPVERLPAGTLRALTAFRRRDLISFSSEPLSEPELASMAIFSRTLIREILGRDLRCAVYLRRYHLDSV